jgi:hypothetical protein
MKSASRTTGFITGNCRRTFSMIYQLELLSEAYLGGQLLKLLLNVFSAEQNNLIEERGWSH